MDRGQVVAVGSVETIKAQVGLKRVRFKSAVAPVLDEVTRTEQEHETSTLYMAEADIVVRNLVQQEIPFEALEILPVSLDEVFLILTGRQL
jgi:ABC-2 type transport system ATP-binding protein